MGEVQSSNSLDQRYLTEFMTVLQMASRMAAVRMPAVARTRRIATISGHLEASPGAATTSLRLVPRSRTPGSDRPLHHADATERSPAVLIRDSRLRSILACRWTSHRELSHATPDADALVHARTAFGLLVAALILLLLVGSSFVIVDQARRDVVSAHRVSSPVHFNSIGFSTESVLFFHSFVGRMIRDATRRTGGCSTGDPLTCRVISTEIGVDISRSRRAGCDGFARQLHWCP